MMTVMRQNASWLCRNHWRNNKAPCLLQCYAAVSLAHEVCCGAGQRSQSLWKSPSDQRRCLKDSKIGLSYKSIVLASSMHLHNGRRFHEHLRMLLQSLIPHYLAPLGSGSIWKYLEALVRLPGVTGRIGCCFWTNQHFADDRAGYWGVGWHRDREEGCQRNLRDSCPAPNSQTRVWLE